MKEEIMVFGPMPGCIKCKKTLELAERVASDLAIVAKKYDIFSDEADKLGIMISPAIVFKGEILSSGTLLTYDKLRRMIEEKL